MRWVGGGAELVRLGRLLLVGDGYFLDLVDACFW